MTPLRSNHTAIATAHGCGRAAGATPFRTVGPGTDRFGILRIVATRMFHGRLTWMLDIYEHCLSIGRPRESSDFAADGAGQKPTDVARCWIRREHLVVADVFPIRLGHIFGGRIGLDPKDAALIE